jgi:hypothetical protein
MRFIIPIAVLMLIFPASIFADTPDPPPVPRITSLQKDHPAPYSGILLNTTAAAKIFAEKDFSLMECDLRIKYAVESETARMNLILNSTRVSMESMQQRYDSIIVIKDKEIERLSTLASQKPNDYSMWWLSGGILAGIGLTIAVVYAVNEVN